jgi:hypothetical protein
MKEFRKNDKGLFVCEECGKTFIKLDGLSRHLKNHCSLKEYFDKWLKEYGEDKCKICRNLVKFNGIYGYKNCCSKECEKKYNIIKFKENCLQKLGVDHPMKLNKLKNEIVLKTKHTLKEKYGDENYNNSEKRIKTNQELYGGTSPMSSKNVQEKYKSTCKENYGVEYPLQSNEILNKMKETNLERFGVEYVFQNEDVRKKWKQNLLDKTGYDHNFKDPKVKEKAKQTCLEKYDNEFFFQSDIFKEKNKNTCIERYGVENPSQNSQIHEKQLKSSFYSHKFKDTNINYRASYEFDFLEKYHPIYQNIQNASRIKYFFNEKEHYYFPDFYISSLNLIIEIKSTRTIKLQSIEKIEAKKKATIANGFNYIMIINKNYDEFELYIKK